MGKTKLVYIDNGTTKLLFGKIESEDNFFIKFITEDGKVFRINKNYIVSIKEFGC